VGLAWGLDNAMRIAGQLRNHRSAKFEPGSACFRGRPPLDQLQAY